MDRCTKCGTDTLDIRTIVLSCNVAPEVFRASGIEGEIDVDGSVCVPVCKGCRALFLKLFGEWLAAT